MLQFMTEKCKRKNSSVHFVTVLHLPTQKHNLTKHIESVHEGKKAFICNICYKRFVQKIHLKRHKAKRQKGVIQDVCKKVI